eukprot:4236080-Amphidinium_carterae.1
MSSLPLRPEGDALPETPGVVFVGQESPGPRAAQELVLAEHLFHVATYHCSFEDMLGSSRCELDGGW